MRAEDASEKRRRSRTWERGGRAAGLKGGRCEGCKGAAGGHSWFKKKYPQIMSLRAKRSNLPCRALRGTPNALNRVWEPRLLRRCAPRNAISAQSADDLPAFFAWFAYFAVGRQSSVCPPPSVVCDPRPSASSAVKKSVVGKMVGGAHPTAVADPVIHFPIRVYRCPLLALKKVRVRPRISLDAESRVR